MFTSSTVLTRSAAGLKRYKTRVRMVWGSFLIAAAALKTPTINWYTAQGVNLNFYVYLRYEPAGGRLRLVIELARRGNTCSYVMGSAFVVCVV